MNPISLPTNRRVLVVDDNPAIHEDFRKILTRTSAADHRLEDLESSILEPEEALRIGYAQQVVAPEELQEAARTEARLYLTTSPFAAARTKELVWKGLERDLAEHMKHHLAAMAECFASADHKEGVASFLERRPAVFTGT